ncbi:response regulator transcription factor [Tsuneonella sp. HG249]
MAGAQRLVHLVDDDEGVRHSVSFMLRTSSFTVTTYSSGVNLLATGDLAVGCILLDIRMPDMDGLEVQAELKRRGSLLPVVIMTGHGEVGLAVQAMKAGAVDFIEKPFEKAQLVEALDEGFARLERAATAQARTDAAEAKLQVLTPREREVLEGLARGFPNKTIAYDLGISARTVEVHRANVMTKLGVPSLSEALRIAFAARLGAAAAEG